MNMRIFISFLIIFSFACKKKQTTIKPEISSITESVYASGILKSEQQYSVYSQVSGVVLDVMVNEGDSVKSGQEIYRLSDEAQRYSKENAALSARYSSLESNKGKLKEANQNYDLAKLKLKTDSSLYFRQQNLWNQQIGSKVDLEQRQLAFENAKAALLSAKTRLDDLSKQLNLSAEQSKNNLLISQSLSNEYSITSLIDGKIYNLAKEKGELVNPQSPIALVGNASNFVLEMQIDEYDILRIKPGMKILVNLDSYKGKTFEAEVAKIYPMMNERSKTFKVEAKFIQMPEKLYPNLTFEANILISRKEKALLLPRNALINDSMLVLANGDTAKVKTGLKDFQKVEIISGISENDEINIPER